MRIANSCSNVSHLLSIVKQRAQGLIDPTIIYLVVFEFALSLLETKDVFLGGVELALGWAATQSSGSQTSINVIQFV